MLQVKVTCQTLHLRGEFIGWVIPRLFICPRQKQRKRFTTPFPQLRNYQTNVETFATYKNETLDFVISQENERRILIINDSSYPIL